MVIPHISNGVTYRVANQREVIASAATGVLLEVAHADSRLGRSGSAFVLEREDPRRKYSLINSLGKGVLMSCRNGLLVFVCYLRACVRFADSTTSRGCVELPVLLRTLNNVTGVRGIKLASWITGIW